MVIFTLIWIGHTPRAAIEDSAAQINGSEERRSGVVGHDDSEPICYELFTLSLATDIRYGFHRDHPERLSVGLRSLIRHRSCIT
jgi:hypothetical protein